MMKREPIGWFGFFSGMAVLTLAWVAVLIGAGLFARAAVVLFCIGYGCS